VIHPVSLNPFLHGCFILTSLTVLCGYSGAVHASPSKVDEYSGVLQVARYSVLRPEPTPSQVDLFGTTRSVVIPQNIVSVKGALEFILVESGYRLAAGPMMPSLASSLLMLPLPKAHRQFDALPFNKILQLIAGPAFTVVHDPVHRLIAFERCRTPKKAAENF